MMLIKILGLLIFPLSFQFSFAKELTDAEIKNRFHLVPEPLCKKVKAREPELPVNSFWYGRYYLSVDGKIDCQILDVKIDWLTNHPTEFRKYLNSVLYRFDGKTWLESRALSYPPKFRLHDRRKNIVYMIVESVDDDFPISEIAFYTGSWGDNKAGKGGVKKLWFCERSQACHEEYMNVKRAVYLYDREK